MDLTGFLKSNKNTRKIFGERELKIIEKQLNGVNLTQSEKNRLSRDIREKFKFIREASKFSDGFELKKGEIIKKIISESKEIILNQPFFNKIEEIILYGSAVENKLTLKSDVDIAIKFDKIGLKEATLLRKSILGKVSPRVDIQIYNDLPEKIKNEIDKRKKILYKK